MREKFFYVEIYRNKDKVFDFLFVLGKCIEYMLWKIGRSVNIMEYFLERGFLFKLGFKISMSYIIL